MKNIKVLLLLLCLYLPLNAQTKFFTTDNGLSSSLVNMVYQDRNGMIWIATEDGLNRYAPAAQAAEGAWFEENAAETLGKRHPPHHLRLYPRERCPRTGTSAW